MFTFERVGGRREGGREGGRGGEVVADVSNNCLSVFYLQEYFASIGITIFEVFGQSEVRIEGEREGGREGGGEGQIKSTLPRSGSRFARSLGRAK